MILIVFFLNMLQLIYIIIEKKLYYVFYIVINTIMINWKYVIFYFIVPTSFITLSVSYLLVQSMRSHTLINGIYRIQKK